MSDLEQMKERAETYLAESATWGPTLERAYVIAMLKCILTGDCCRRCGEVHEDEELAKPFLEAL